MATRWGSTLLMVQRLLLNKDAVLVRLNDHPNNVTIPSEGEWAKLSVLEKLLLPLEEASTMIGGEKYITASIVLPMFTHLKKAMTPSEEDPGYAVKFKEAFIVDLVNRIGNAYDNGYLSLATALDVRFKSLKCLPKQKRETTWSLLLNVMRDEAPEPAIKAKRYNKSQKFDFELSDSEDDCAEVGLETQPCDAALKELTAYKSAPHEENLMMEPLQYWKANRSSFPILSKLATKYLALPASSVPVERLFSAAGEIVSKKRTLLSTSNVNMLICLHY